MSSTSGSVTIKQHPSLQLRSQTARPSASAALPRLRLQCLARADGRRDPAGLFSTDRREVLSLALTASLFAASGPASAVDTKAVGTYLPPYGKDDLVLFVPGPRETPAIRAGTIDPTKPYSFALPPTWKRDPVANIASGNYCQPRCAEPWTEVIFSSPANGRAQVIISPLVRLINKSDAPLEEIGPPEGLINSFGPYISGTNVEEEEVISAEAKNVDGRTYYVYETYTPYGTQPPHGLAALTTKGDAAILFVINATDKQWSTSKDMLHKVVDSFIV
mmetsp:Transcript_1656/g.4763  ORF Transcript_1656/g.4763 Transcript_1656/m.4763 type:complete len:276 (-) Transcript_1656:1838-2665(-)|eukprot:CAMPEP_0117655078 /NCGR_PEP_ID=MMETSP0804-20121206/4089_1 /TAXON_ID=1074897 /ORGANISM="Tetraselmis astigmatica, Strain CCMP880" /LENGTH=275 /DNA_ID=CAMNT_0005461409 /DNA_START=88 /DNA_END=915 /DNA_ORIENTATION=+